MDKWIITHPTRPLATPLSLTHGYIFWSQMDMLPAPNPYWHMFSFQIASYKNNIFHDKFQKIVEFIKLLIFI